ncbi:MAG: SsrA-binding protein SmpB [Firmicutes bacterium]|nr:SsrA-binding protein SmpB [Bacillota bacterium]
MAKESFKLVAQNRKAHHDYFLEELYEAGLSLSGTEVKSLRQGKCSLKESYVAIERGEALIYNMHISPYEHGNIFNKDPLRVRKLLLHKREIRKLIGAVKQDGYTIVPVRLYFKGNYAKLEIALAKGKKLYDKRESIAKKDQRREAERDYKISKMY